MMLPPLRRGLPLIAFVAALLAGSMSMIRFVPRDAGPLPPLPKPPPFLFPLLLPPPAPAAAPVPEIDIQALRNRLSELLNAIRERKSANDATSAELEALQKKVDELRAELETLEARRTAMIAAPANAPSADDTLETQVADDRTQVAAGEEDLAAIKAAPESKLANPQFRGAISPFQKLPAPVELNGNRIAPVDRDFFRFPLIVLSSSIVVTRKHPGETIAEAQRPDSMFAKFLARVRKEHCYISCLLNGDSFEAFFAVREMARRAGLDVSWEPAWTADGNVAITRVRLVRKASVKQKTVALPEIVR